MNPYIQPAPAVEAHTALRDAVFSAADAIGRHHVDDFPGLLEFVQDQVLVVVGRPTRNAHGWIAPDTWRNAASYATEIYISADIRSLTPSELATDMWTAIAHELAHGVNFIKNVNDVSRQGRWHNRRFAEVAIALGLEIIPDPSVGHLTTGRRTNALTRYIDEITAIQEALALAWYERLPPSARCTGRTAGAERRPVTRTTRGEYRRRLRGGLWQYPRQARPVDATQSRVCWDVSGGACERAGRNDSHPLSVRITRGATTMELRPASATVKTPASNFTGDVWMNPVFGGDEVSPLVVGLVRFTPGARTNWHSHANGQLLVCTDGIGLVVTRDGTAIRLTAGETVWTPAGEEHWHGGTSENMMCHYAILDETAAKDATVWLEPVTDEQYSDANAVV